MSPYTGSKLPQKLVVFFGPGHAVRCDDNVETLAAVQNFFPNTRSLPESVCEQCQQCSASKVIAQFTYHNKALFVESGRTSETLEANSQESSRAQLQDEDP